MKKNSFLRGAGLLAFSVVIAKILGAVYRIPLTNIIGAEGMGIYQFVYPVFALILTLSSGAVPTAISLTIAESVVINDENKARRDFAVAIKVCLIVGISGTLALLAIAYPISLMQSKDALIGYLVVAPAIFIVTIISAFRGWFMGHKNMMPYSLSQISEGIVKLVFGIAATYLLLPFGIKYAVAGALGGVLISELVTLLILFFTYKKKDKTFEKVAIKDNKPALKKLWRLVLPLVLGGIILPFSQFIDSLLFVNLLKFGGNSLSNSTVQYGIFAGTVTPLINLPVMVCITLGIAITPQMVEGKIKRSIDFIMDKVSIATKIIFALCVPFILIFIFLGDTVIGLLYPTLGAENIALASKLLSISALSILALSVFQIYSAMLQGLDKIYVPLKIMGVCVALKIILNIVLIPFAGMVGAAISATIAFTLAAAVVMFYFFNYVRVVDNLAKNTSLITLCGAIMSLIIVINIRLQKNPITLILTATVSVIIYFIFLLVLRVFTKDELQSMPMGRVLVRIDTFLHRK
ncbi:MAG TPA: polysaccharide biosynthesis protein [Clostridia bacterium]|nr:polysaccharide biosynthesis protein [Clostridia bacterium]